MSSVDGMSGRFSMRKLLEEKNIHLFFEISLLFKAAFALAEVAGGILAYVITQRLLLDIVRAITQAELAEDPRDFIANSLLQAAQAFSISTQRFTAIYLLGHGIVKLWLIVGLLRKRLWYYPTAMVVFGLFMAYQLYRFTFTHSILLLLITVLDVVILGLTWHEYNYLSRTMPPAAQKPLS